MNIINQNRKSMAPMAKWICPPVRKNLSVIGSSVGRLKARKAANTTENTPTDPATIPPKTNAIND